MNHVQIVGNVYGEPEKVDDGTSVLHTKIPVAITSNFREANGTYREDVMDIYLWQGAAKTMLKHINIGQIIAIKGRLECHDAKIIVVAEVFEVLRPK